MNLDKTQFIIDSTLSTTSAEMSQRSITMVPLYISIDAVSYRDMEDLHPETLYAMMREKKRALTSQPPVGDFLTVYEKAKAEGKTDCIVFTLDSNLSGTYQSAHQAAQLIEGIRVTVIDTGLSSAVCGYQIQRLHEFAKDHTLDELIIEAELLFTNTGLAASVGNLDYLLRGGRLSKANAMIANLLKIKPILTYLHKQPIKVVKKERTLAGMLNTILDLVEEQQPKIAFLLTSDALNQEAEAKLQDVFQKRFPDIPLIHYPLCSVLGAHLGPESYIIAYSKV